MGMREEVLKHVRRIESCHSSAEVEACINLIIIEAALQAAEVVKEEAAKVCGVLPTMIDGTLLPQSCAAAIRAINPENL